jgi:hypothetical protein
MPRSIAVRIGTALVALVVGSLGLVPSASADAPFAYGWWTATNLGRLPDLDGLLPEIVGPIALPNPDVPADGMLVQGGPIDPVAYGALVYDIDPDSAADQLVLPLPSGVVAIPGTALRLCPLVSSSLRPDVGGPIADAPGYDCASEVAGALNPEGTAFTFPVGGLLVDGLLAVAVLPTLPSDRVVLAAPGVDSLVVAGAAPTEEPEATTPTTLPPGLAVTTGGGGGGSSFSAPSFTPAAPLAASAAPVAAPSSPVAAPTAPAGFPVPIPDEAKPFAVVALATALLVAASLWYRAGRPASEQPLASASA